MQNEMDGQMEAGLFRVSADRKYLGWALKFMNVTYFRAVGSLGLRHPLEIEGALMRSNICSLFEGDLRKFLRFASCTV